MRVMMTVVSYPYHTLGTLKRCVCVGSVKVWNISKHVWNRVSAISFFPLRSRQLLPTSNLTCGLIHMSHVCLSLTHLMKHTTLRSRHSFAKGDAEDVKVRQDKVSRRCGGVSRQGVEEVWILMLWLCAEIHIHVILYNVIWIWRLSICLHVFVSLF